MLIGDGLGSVSRYLVSSAAGRWFGDSFAWGTMLVNLVGHFLIGLVVGLADRALVSRTFRIILVTGFLGKGIANIGINVVLGMALTLAGLFAANRI